MVITVILPACAQGKNLYPGIYCKSNSSDTTDIVNKKTSGNAAKKIPKPLKVFVLFPTPANNIVYVHISGKQVLTLRNANDSLIFKASIREKAIINLTKLPEGNYILRDEKTGETRPLIIAR